MRGLERFLNYLQFASNRSSIAKNLKKLCLCEDRDFFFIRETFCLLSFIISKIFVLH